ncbi:MAG: DUF4398 domain-containing protein [Acidobacteria bacterium]|nr:DUF4398 domain-containing protein [Acidobacteriota bacterium]
MPPEDELEEAQKQIEIARKREANFYAPELLRDAEELLSEASLKVSEKSYSEARNLANEARAKAEQATEVASENEASQRQRGASFQSDVERQLPDLRKAIETLGSEHASERPRLAQEVLEIEGLLQIYKDKIVARRFNEMQNMEGPIQQKLQQVSANLDSLLHAGNTKKNEEKKR